MKTQRLTFSFLIIAAFAAVAISMKSNSGVKETLSFAIEKVGEAATGPRILNPEVLNHISFPYEDGTTNITGTVKFKIMIDDAGQVKGWKVLHTPHEALSEACFKQLKKLQFNPALDDNDLPMASWVQLKINFETSL